MSLLARRELRLLTLLGDLLALSVAFKAAATLRLALNPLFEKQLTEAQMEYLVPPLGLVFLLWTVAGAWMGLYRPRPKPFMFSAAVQAVEAMALVVVLTIVVVFFVRDLGRDYSRSFIIFLVALGGAALLANRALISLGFLLASRRGLVRERILLVGAGRGAASLIHRLEESERRRVLICGVVTPEVGLGAGVLGNPVPIVGTVDELPALINRYRIDRVIAVEKETPAEQMQSCITVCTRMGIAFNHTAGHFERTVMRVGVTELGNVLLIEVRGIEFTRIQQAVKRAFDLLTATALLVLLTPLLAALALGVWLTSRGPVLYIALRVGKGGRYFPFLKFRTMVRGADAQRDDVAARNEQKGHLFKIRRDPRVTAIGRFMRLLSLDELPQLLNVIWGQMSLVGPRPLPARDLDPDGLSREYRVWAVQRTKVPPGITGLWQIRGRSDLSFEEMLSLDITYVRYWSIWLDMKIIAKTIPAILRGRGAC
jgi:exopolysaccharide biosynthesis polyprenyl glycosylphosphotransferase